MNNNLGKTDNCMEDKNKTSESMKKGGQGRGVNFKNDREKNVDSGKKSSHNNNRC